MELNVLNENRKQIIKCPRLLCMWFGPKDLFVLHCEEVHKGITFSNGDWIPEGFDFAVLKFEGRIVIVTVDSVPTEENGHQVTVSFQNIGTKPSSGEFYYFKLYINDMTGKELSGKVLSEPQTFSTSVSSINRYNINISYGNGCSDTIRGLFPLLECSSCFNTLKSPVYQSSDGIMFCADCKPCKHYYTCICGFQKNVLANEILEKMKISCSMYGCTQVCAVQDVQVHEEACELNVFTVPCPVNPLGCEWTGIPNCVLEHVQQTHFGNMLHNFKIMVPSEMGIIKEQKFCYVFSCHRNVFRLLCEYENNIFRWIVQLIGPSCKYDRFIYIVNITSDDDSVYFKTSSQCQPYTNQSSVQDWITFYNSPNIVNKKSSLVYEISISQV